MEQNTKHALVTGGTSGIGWELAKLLAKDGYNIILVARGEEGLEKSQKELEQTYSISVETISKDLFYAGNAFELVDEIKAKGITIDILVNDAGQGLYGEFKDTDIQRELAIVQLNISSLLVLTKAFLQDMVARGDGKILNLASIAGKLPGPLQAVYHGTKAFVHSFTEAIRSETKDSGVTITSLLPGATDTDFFHKAGMEQSKVVQAGQLADPAEVAKDGYNALMSGDDMVVSGFKNKVQVGMSNILPDSTVADRLKKQQEPVDKK
ncbi:MAG: SDR family oxidoreductase [Bacteroidetes bacterium]|nr:SDR family oxidoreductase [Bacteroidota bacterium]